MLTVSDLDLYYGDAQALDGVTLQVAAGQTTAIVGANGAGKTSLIRAISGILKPAHGSIRFKDREIAGLPSHVVCDLGIGQVAEGRQIFPTLSVRENLEMGAVIRRDDVRARLTQVLGLFPNLAGKRRQKVGDLSGGERQMVAMSRALMLDPRLLLLDEPSAGLAPVMVDAVFAKIVEIHRTGVAVVLVEQNAREALRLSQRAYVLVGGQNRLEGSGEALLDNPEVGRLYRGG